jgi:hypothetical protein
MPSTCFESECSTAGRLLHKQERYSVLNVYEKVKCVPYTLLYLQECLQIVMNTLFTNNRGVCVCVCVCGLCTVCDVTYHNVWQRTVCLLPGACNMFRAVQTARLTPIGFREFLINLTIFFTFLHHFTTTFHSPPLSRNLDNCYLQSPFTLYDNLIFW